jgi:hypothetical protein
MSVPAPQRVAPQPQQKEAAGNFDDGCEEFGVGQEGAEADRYQCGKNQYSKAVAHHGEDRDGSAPGDAPCNSEEHARPRDDDDREGSQGEAD